MAKFILGLCTGYALLFAIALTPILHVKLYSNGIVVKYGVGWGMHLVR